MYTIDASVWVNRFDPREPGHEASRELLDLLIEDESRIIVPNLVFIEVAGAIRRRHNNQEDAIAFVEVIRGLAAITAVPLDDELSQAASVLAAQQALRGADAVYAAVAARHHCILVSLDNEHLTRLLDVVETRTPAQVVAELLPPEAP